MTQLSESDLALWLKVIRAQPDQQSSSLLEWMTGPLKQFFPFERCLLVHGELTAGQIKMTDWLNCEHEQKYLVQLKETFELSQRGSLAWWLSNQQPFGIDPAAPPPFATEFEVNELRSFGLGRIAAHGVVNVKANAGTYFSFSGIPKELSSWHMDALRLIAPVLNDLFLAYARSQRIPPLNILQELSPRQNEIVRQLATGMSDRAIASQIGVSEKTVRNHLAAIYAIVGVKGRAQLIALLR